MSTDQSRELRDAILICLASILDPEYKQLQYVTEIEKNSFTNSKNRYGVRAGEVIELVNSTLKFETYSHNFTVVLAKGYGSQSVDDDDAQEASYDLREFIFEFYKKAFNTKLGSPAIVLNITNLAILEPTFLESDKVAVLNANFDVNFRISLV